MEPRFLPKVLVEAGAAPVLLPSRLMCSYFEDGLGCTTDVVTSPVKGQRSSSIVVGPRQLHLPPNNARPGTFVTFVSNRCKTFHVPISRLQASESWHLKTLHFN